MEEGGLNNSEEDRKEDNGIVEGVKEDTKGRAASNREIGINSEQRDDKNASEKEKGDSKETKEHIERSKGHSTKEGLVLILGLGVPDQEKNRDIRMYEGENLDPTLDPGAILLHRAEGRNLLIKRKGIRIASVRTREEEKPNRSKNTLFDVIRDAEQKVKETMTGTIPNFDLIEPKYAYGKDIYIGNIQEGTYPEDVIAFLNKAMIAANLNIWPGQPVLSCRILPKYCFVSLRHEDEASNALSLDGIFFHGQRLKFNRPVDYMGPPTTHSSWPELCPNISWPEMYEAYGLDYKWILKELDNVPQAVIDICAGVDGAAATPLLEVINIVTSLDIEARTADADTEGIKEEVKEEMAKYGEVVDIVIPSSLSTYAGKVYVRYTSAESALKAYEALRYRMFDNRLLGVNYFSETQWELMLKDLKDLKDSEAKK